MESHKNKLDMEYDQLMANFSRELESLRDKHLKDLDKWVCIEIRRGEGEDIQDSCLSLPTYKAPSEDLPMSSVCPFVTRSLYVTDLRSECTDPI